MPRKKKELTDVTKEESAKFVDQDSEFISGLLEATKLAKLESDDFKLDFSEDEINLPEPIPVRQATPKRKPAYLPGDHFYLYFGHKRVKGKWKVRGSFAKLTKETKQIERKDGEIVTVHIRKQSNPSKAWLARKKDAA
jgi:hypothetical protein